MSRPTDPAVVGATVERAIDRAADRLMERLRSRYPEVARPRTPPADLQGG